MVALIVRRLGDRVVSVARRRKVKGLERQRDQLVAEAKILREAAEAAEERADRLTELVNKAKKIGW